MALEKKLSDFDKALQRLEESYEKTVLNQNNEEYSFFRDATIQRFEFTLEIAWKSIKHFLLEYEGVSCQSPKGCVREFLSCGYLTQAQTVGFLEMIDDRNLSTHTYHEEVAETIFMHIKRYLPLLKHIYKLLDKS